MKTNIFTLLIALSFSHISAICALNESQAITKESRAAQTCGDPSVATTYYESFGGQSLAGHAFNTMAQFVATQTLGQDWRINRPSFLAWPFPGEPGTVPLYQLDDSATTDVVYLISTNGAVPTLSGFSSVGILTYVYPTQICGSVPLYAAAGPGDHWYTTNLVEHDELITDSGWSDDGIAAYVVPLDSTSCSCSS